MIHAKKLNHVNLNVSDIGRSLKFYQEGLGLQVAFWEGKTMVFLNSPGADDTITLCQAHDGDAIGNGGVSHFGFAVGAANMDEAVSQIERAGGKLIRQGKHGGRFPFAYISDPDGYVIELG
jgi:lactoylglutathione lyase